MTEFGLTARASGSGSVVFTTERWAKQLKRLKQLTSQAKLIALITDNLANYRYVPGQQPPGWLKGPLGHAHGVLELKTEGARAYGRFVGYDADGRSVFVFDAVENKAHGQSTDTALAKEAADTIQQMINRWGELAVAHTAERKDVIDIGARRKK